MRTILIAERDLSFSNELAEELRAAHYHVIDCPGPWPPAERCIRCDVGYCPLTEGADLMIYDPMLTALDDAGHRYNLALESARVHPDIPMLLVWPPDEPPDVGILREIRADAPQVHVAERTRAGRLEQIRSLLAASAASTGASR
jgi:hypothetical protein